MKIYINQYLIERKIMKRDKKKKKKGKKSKERL